MAVVIVAGAVVVALAAIVNAWSQHQKLDHILAAVAGVQAQGATTMADLSAITAAVASNSDVVDSAVVLIQRIAADLAAAATDPVAVQALADQLNADAAELAAAVAQNTPAEPEPVEPPVEPTP